MSKTFIKNKEDFVCSKCGYFVKGSGYTNHCPKCLWSEHIDNFPGDREAKCSGLMEPIGLDMKNGECRIVHQCVKCSHRKPNKVSELDDADKILELSTKVAISRL